MPKIYFAYAKINIFLFLTVIFKFTRKIWGMKIYPYYAYKHSLRQMRRY